MYTQKEIISSVPLNNQTKIASDHSLPGFNLMRMIGILKHGRKWERGEMNMMILLKSPGKRIILAIVHDNTEITSKQVDESVAFQVVEGKIKLYFSGELVILKRGELFTLTEKTKYRIDSEEESSFLMTLKSFN
jgi:hypothetical protein